MRLNACRLASHRKNLFDFGSGSFADSRDLFLMPELHLGEGVAGAGDLRSECGAGLGIAGLGPLLRSVEPPFGTGNFSLEPRPLNLDTVDRSTHGHVSFRQESVRRVLHAWNIPIHGCADLNGR